MKKLETNWRSKTLENLEKDFWGEPNYDSYLVRRTHAIRKLPLNKLTAEDVAMMLRQQFSLDYLVPLAIDKLQENGLADEKEDIIKAIHKLPSVFWEENKEYWNTIQKLLD